MAISWTKYWQGSDDGTILRGIDLRNIQDDLAVVQTVDDVLSIPGQTQGDVLYYNGSSWVRLAAGTAGEVLTTQGAGSNPTWDLPADLSVSGQTTGDLLYFDGSNWVRISPGASGTVLTSNGTGVAPSFEDPAGLSNVVFSWYGTDNGAGTNGRGIYSGTSLNPANGGDAPMLTLCSMQTSFVDLVTWKYKHMAGISSLSVYCRIWVAQTNTVYLQATVGGQTHATISTTSTSPAWQSPQTIDVSGLTPGTVYDASIAIKVDNVSIHGLCSSITIFGG